MTRAIFRLMTNCYLISDKYFMGDNENVTYYVTFGFGELGVLVEAGKWVDLRVRVERRGR